MRPILWSLRGAGEKVGGERAQVACARVRHLGTVRSASVHNAQKGMRERESNRVQEREGKSEKQADTGAGGCEQEKRVPGSHADSIALNHTQSHYRTQSHAITLVARVGARRWV